MEEEGNTPRPASQTLLGENAWQQPSPRALEAGLYLVATPIGNLRDITLRALDILHGVDLIACEDTRVTRTLLSAYNIRTSTTSYGEHNADRARPDLMTKLKDGAKIALVSDAGTPLISDPGYKLVRECAEGNIPVIAIPGASALLCGLSIAAQPTDSFFFAGFLPAKSSARQSRLKELAMLPTTLVFYESPRRLPESLMEMAECLGKDRPAAICREMTKRFEEARRATLTELAAYYAEAGSPKGEVVVVIGPPDASEHLSTADDLDAMLITALASLSVKEASSTVAEALRLPRKEVYQRALELKNLKQESA